ncbi:hypothetical protein [Flavobacterium sp. GT3P67]|uniref:hypothetical protein n=1 Tax=Flavobacterium sp. GT3P67 TaxID=2541722 RepID=UPI00104DD7EC|nr:hypothetical protein [Flavobacterium sp. GT3P67]TDE54441.1 hypothetical protein E0H99_06265 [Flavobacterium sp. GT3P67]
MKKIILLTLLSISLYAIGNEDPVKLEFKKNELEANSNINQTNILESKIAELQKDYEKQEKINEKTLDSISNQISAASLNLTIFGILFSVAAIGLGLYVTFIERKIVLIREENKTLLSETKLVKDEVVKINNQIQKDIYGLFLKIKREETVHILERLLKIPEDISNLSQQLLSRELEKEDFLILKEAYLKLKEKNSKINENSDEDDEEFNFDLKPDYINSYKLLFFQHFLDLSIKDSIINDDLLDYYNSSVDCAFENDIIKSTTDFMNSIMETGLQSKTIEVNAFVKALSQSDFKTFDAIYQIFFQILQTRENHFKLFNILNDEKETRVGKLKIGQILTDKYSHTQLSESEKNILDKTNTIFLELEAETAEKNIKLEKQKAAKAERIRKQEELKNKKQQN